MLPPRFSSLLSYRDWLADVHRGQRVDDGSGPTATATGWSGVRGLEFQVTLSLSCPHCGRVPMTEVGRTPLPGIHGDPLTVLATCNGCRRPSVHRLTDDGDRRLWPYGRR